MIGGIFCFSAVDLKKFYAQKYDDACDVFGVHGVGGMVRVKIISKSNKYKIITIWENVGWLFIDWNFCRKISR